MLGLVVVAVSAGVLVHKRRLKQAALAAAVQVQIATTPSGASVRIKMCIRDSLEYHPNVEAVRWFRSVVWPQIRERSPGLEWRLIGKNPDAVARWTSGDDRIRVVGPVEDAVAEIARAKVAVVPLLSGSGTRFKICLLYTSRCV